MHRLSPMLAAMAVTAGLAGCVPPPIALDAPARSASWQQRADAYTRLRPTSVRHTDILGGDTGKPIDDKDHTLVLADGSRVRQGAELLPLVDGDSPTAAAVRTERSNETWRQRLLIGGVSLLAAGAAVAAASLFTSRDGANPATYAGVGLATAGAGLSIASLQLRRRAIDARLTAYRTYDEALRERLGVCVVGIHLVDCDAPIAGPRVAPPTSQRQRTMEIHPLPPE
jgi:hypothetical protein